MCKGLAKGSSTGTWVGSMPKGIAKGACAGTWASGMSKSIAEGASTGTWMDLIWLKSASTARQVNGIF